MQRMAGQPGEVLWQSVDGRYINKGDTLVDAKGGTTGGAVWIDESGKWMITMTKGEKIAQPLREYLERCGILRSGCFAVRITGNILNEQQWSECLRLGCGGRGK